MSLLNAKSTSPIRVSVFLTVKALSETTNQTCTSLSNHPFSFLRHIRSLNPFLSVRQPTLTLHPLFSTERRDLLTRCQAFTNSNCSPLTRSVTRYKQLKKSGAGPRMAYSCASAGTRSRIPFCHGESMIFERPPRNSGATWVFHTCSTSKHSRGPTLWIASTPLTVKRSYFSSENRPSELEVLREVRNRDYTGSRIENQRNETFFLGRTSIFVCTASFVGRTGKGIWFRVHDQDQFQRTDFSKLCVRSESHSSDLREAIFIITIYWLDFLLFLSQMEIRYWRKARNWRKFGR